ncbi:Acetophenone carboxylase gamma subunit [Pirellula sp. SH-Sr6A]|uniref:hydantoinase B/oxoprolinase family protein n=1 Tax=Pirellula sp. SH-Sr6A TaxID=1632865 RepID=UPI00078DBBAA|nr:hydantoinase B/oxoprolinase family protein [Pirellula sp. SH-Sr6A]AMV34266.1 Acetophenone carboxylase gamma subunit [Pirellula sp. SH-Sr6A]
MNLAKIQVWCDVGGTFTDCIVRFPDGQRKSIKVLSHGVVQGVIANRDPDGKFTVSGRNDDPNAFWLGATLCFFDTKGHACGESTCSEYRNGTFSCSPPLLPQSHSVEIRSGMEAPILATRLLLGIAPTQSLPPLSIRLGTTRGTNALLTRTGERTLFVTTKGFADLLAIGYQERPSLFELSVCKRPVLYDRVMEIEERLDAAGNVSIAMDLEQARAQLKRAYDEGYRTLAVCFIHAYLQPEHERAIYRLAEEIGFHHTVLSHEVAPMIKAVSRGETTVLDAYLTPIIQTYLHRVREQFQQADADDLLIMTSAGGLVRADEYRGKDSVLSGPAGGAVALQSLGKSLGFPQLVGLDMGGTSTDVCRVDGELDLEFETVKAGVRMMTPTLRIHTVAAGGGSICWFDGVQLRVGPQSAGSQPGPACYGRGGPLTVTDLNVLAQRIRPESFPFPLDVPAAQRALQDVLQSLNATRPESPMSEWILIEGFRTIANEHMASAVRTISISQGADPREHALVCFGGAAGQHICQIAEQLGMTTILDPPQAGLLSAVGMGLATKQQTQSTPVYQLVKNLDAGWFEKIQSVLIAPEFRASDQWTTQLRIEARFAGTEGTIALRWTAEHWSPHRLEQLFREEHRKRFGYDRPNREVEIAVMHASIASKPLREPAPQSMEEGNTWIRSTSLWLDREEMEIGATYIGPLIVVSSGSTTCIDPGWRGTVLGDRTLLIRKQSVDSPENALPSSAIPQARTERIVDPVQREVFAQRLSAIATQMGTVLEQTAISVNVKDRKDFSCAVFHRSGDLIANAPHVPVHLGAMSATVQAVCDQFRDMKAGDCFITNDPYRGGSHLPDVTVITPVFANRDEENAEPDFFVACRAHHAEIGGIAPGSMAPNATCLAHEGVLIPPMRIADGGTDRSGDVERLLREAEYPSRNVEENLADIAAQQAANQYGCEALQELARRYGVRMMESVMEDIQAASQQKTEQWIASLPEQPMRFLDWMDDGTPIAVSITKTRDRDQHWRLRIDFSGTGPESRGNLNANPAIVTAATIYVIRCAIADDLPLNSGVMRCIDLFIPPGILNPSRRELPDRLRGPADGELLPSLEGDYWPAVAGGNVETSQRVVDCLLGALGLAALSQGTMNNFLFGNQSFGYYETIGGGAGATATHAGESAVHTHMTNTRLTDVEILEKRYPVRLVRFRVRRGSGGAGQQPGGEGIEREVQALVPLTVCLVTSRRGEYPPQGLAGGSAGKPGENWWIRANGESSRLGSNAQIDIEAGDSIRILTPGGGGYGPPLRSDG